MSDLVEKVRNEIFALRSSKEILPGQYETDVQYELQRIFAELLRNIQEHSQATSITLSLHDNGVGGAGIKEGHYGLTGIGERVRELEGVLDIESNQSGTQISITVPWVRA